ncbi:unnamed protein product, partial [Polarella glacialis]
NRMSSESSASVPSAGRRTSNASSASGEASGSAGRRASIASSAFSDVSVDGLLKADDEQGVVNARSMSK